MANPGTGTRRAEPLGRREAHKAATRKALQEAARRMFEERGYARTTVRDIASAAGVTERTFFRYFPSKEELVLAEVLDLIPHIRTLVVHRPADESPYAAALAVVLELAADEQLGVMFSGPPQRFPDPSPRQLPPVLLQFEDGLAQAFQERLALRDPATATPLRAAVLARAAAGAIRSALFAYAALPEPDRTLTVAHDLLRTAFGHLDG
ncbi:transcriptional regulator, TetR family [Actinobacteria bacterium OK074]|nr:transcriptional regulator, TetR family [Actinobacteria bacterium OK074]